MFNRVLLSRSKQTISQKKWCHLHLLNIEMMFRNLSHIEYVSKIKLMLHYQTVEMYAYNLFQSIQMLMMSNEHKMIKNLLESMLKIKHINFHYIRYVGPPCIDLQKPNIMYSFAYRNDNNIWNLFFVFFFLMNDVLWGWSC